MQLASLHRLHRSVYLARDTTNADLINSAGRRSAQDGGARWHRRRDQGPARRSRGAILQPKVSAAVAGQGGTTLVLRQQLGPSVQASCRSEETCAAATQIKLVLQPCVCLSCSPTAGHLAEHQTQGLRSNTHETWQATLGRYEAAAQSPAVGS